GGRDHQWLGLFQARLHESVELVQLFQQVFPVQDGLLWPQVDPQLLGYRHHFLDIRDCVHTAPPFSPSSPRLDEQRRATAVVMCAASPGLVWRIIARFSLRSKHLWSLSPIRCTPASAWSDRRPW